MIPVVFYYITSDGLMVRRYHQMPAVPTEGMRLSIDERNEHYVVSAVLWTFKDPSNLVVNVAEPGGMLSGRLTREEMLQLGWSAA
ncbi:MAG: hypothetical protein JWQ03_1631 [Variovorax sp.]|nr:hypothetical protein [Variovorax sp.]